MGNKIDSIAMRIADSRKKLGLSQAQFAQMHGFALPTFARWEVGKTEPKASDIKALAKALNVSVAFLLGDNTSDEKEILKEEEKNIDPQGDILAEDILFKHDSTELVFKKGTNVNSISKVIEQVNKGLSISQFPTDEESDISFKPAVGGDTSR